MHQKKSPRPIFADKTPDAVKRRVFVSEAAGAG
jgi:hypothetical protein